MKKLFALLAICSIALVGCTSTDPNIKPTDSNPLTHGNVQLTLRKGVTTQADVLQAFGAPNITTIDSEGREVWSYQKHASVAQASSASGGVGIGGILGSVILGGGVSSSKSGLERSSRTMTLIIKFDAAKTVCDFSSMSSSF